ncbi:DDE_3 domain-containing protein [Trichonephila clavipes]|nr:DDE_3 domain-containing protein [Trichonephila clavipes]
MRGTLTGQRYVDDILRPHVGPFLNGLPGTIFQQVNARSHIARVAQDFLRHFQTLPWPTRSPDLSPVEHVWDQLKWQMPSCHSVHDLELAVQDLWAHLPQDNIRCLINSMPVHRQFFIFQLNPGTDYSFKVWATNKLGPGEAVTVRATTCKPVDPPEVFGKMLADAENFGSTAWLLAICMLAVTVLTLSLLSFALVFKQQRNGKVVLKKVFTI